MRQVPALERGESFVGPSLAKAKLRLTINKPRRKEDLNQDTNYILAPCREVERALAKGLNIDQDYEKYSWGGLGQLTEFGIGITLYFYQLLSMVVIMIMCSIIYIYTFVYYIDDQASSTPGLVKGSAAGMDTKYEFKAVLPDCFACIMLVAFALSFRYYRKKVSTAIDLQQQTAQDYSIRVHNPPRDADDVNEWRDFFQEFGDVVNVTVCKNNGSLMRALGEAKLVEQELETAKTETPHSFPLNLSCVLNVVQMAGFLLDEQYWLRRKLRGKRALRKLCREDNLVLQYHVTNVFVSFDKEHAQRTCLEQMAAGLTKTTTGGRCLGAVCASCCATSVDPTAQSKLFRGSVQLDLSEPEEPSEILWANLDYSLLGRALEQVVTWSCAILILVLAWKVQSSLVGGKRADSDSSASNDQINGIFVALVNYLVVQVMVALSNSEHHKDEGNLQASTMLKFLIVRFINTAVLPFVNAAPELRASESLMTSVTYILLFDAFLGPVLRLLDPYTWFARRFLAPRATTQREMDTHYNGVWWSLAERYSAMLNTTTVSLFYCSVLPAGLLIAAVSFLLNFVVDYHLLLHRWRRAPAVDGELAIWSGWWILGAVWVHLIISGYYYAAWPFPTWCELDAPTFNNFCSPEGQSAVAFEQSGCEGVGGTWCAIGECTQAFAAVDVCLLPRLGNYTDNNAAFPCEGTRGLFEYDATQIRNEILRKRCYNAAGCLPSDTVSH
jgi:hypothetical protein